MLGVTNKVDSVKISKFDVPLLGLKKTVIFGYVIATSISSLAITMIRNLFYELAKNEN